MKYSIRFYANCRVLDKADEIIIKYNKRNSNLINFVENKKQEQRIVINLTELDSIEDNIDILAAAKEKHENIAFMISLSQSDKFNLFLDREMQFFFLEGIDTWDALSSIVKLGVSDVYIINELGFDLKRVSNFCHSSDVKIRVYPNVAQSQSAAIQFDNLDTFKFFFVRPEDLDFYEKYIDIIEFFGPLDRQAVLYEIYNEKEWADNLKYLIIGLKKDVDSNCIANDFFAPRRADCGKMCSVGKCHVCDRILSLANAMKENGYDFSKSRKREYRVTEEDMRNEESGSI